MGKYNPQNHFRVGKFGRKKHKGNLANLKQNCGASNAPAHVNPAVRTELSPISEEKVVGNRIVDFVYMFEEFKRLDCHNKAFGCSFNNIELLHESRMGLQTRFFFQCNFCNEKFTVANVKEKEETLDLNSSAIAGIMSIGGGFYNLEEFFASIAVPSMTQATYNKYQKLVGIGWEATAFQQMKQAASEEAEYAKSINSVDEEGYPLVTVITDGCWSKRSYRNNYTALSGVAAIVGQHTKKVLYLGVRNKFCTICSRSASKGEKPENHDCSKNHIGSSSSMESAIIVEGFRNSLPWYGIKYNRMIADGDSSTYKKLLDARPYNNLSIEKIECRNHILRNYANKLRLVTADTNHLLCHRKLLEGRIMRLRTAVVCAISHHKSNPDSVKGAIFLQNDIKNSVHHVLGNHSMCAEYFCKGKDEKNHIPDIKDTLFFKKVLQINNMVANNARSLLFDVDSNIVEQFNSIVTKFVGGKRINYCFKKSYQNRCAAAVVSFNSRRPHYELHRTMCGSNPSNIMMKMESNRFKKTQLVRNHRKILKLCTRTKLPVKTTTKTDRGDPDYGSNCEKPDMPIDLFEKEKIEFLGKLKRTHEERISLKNETVLQAGSGKWMEERRKLLTASNFQKICRRRKDTSCQNVVRSLLYDTKNLNVPSLLYGKDHEEDARKALEIQENLKIQPCGLFVDETLFYLGASPDGVIDDNRIVELKCPSSANNMPIDEAIKKRKINFWKQNTQGDLFINKSHSWYYQVQGQLHITKANICVFAVWTGHEQPLKVEYIEKDNNFWAMDMEPYLTKFYMDCLLPELVDPRHTRNMPIRDPHYIIDAINQKKSRQEEKLKK